MSKQLIAALVAYHAVRLENAAGINYVRKRLDTSNIRLPYNGQKSFGSGRGNVKVCALCLSVYEGQRNPAYEPYKMLTCGCAVCTYTNRHLIDDSNINKVVTDLSYYASILGIMYEPVALGILLRVWHKSLPRLPHVNIRD